MALNCTTCAHKHNAVSQGHCTEFSHIPEVDACAMHTEGKSASKATAAPVVPKTQNPESGYIWLQESHPASKVNPSL